MAIPNDPVKRVWILGAGFSYPLGAPLFTDLFGNAYERLARGIQDWFRDQTDDDHHERRYFRRVAAKVFAEGIENDYWRDPEQFLQRANDCLKSRKQSVLWDWLRDRSTNAVPIGGEQRTLRERHARTVAKELPDFVVGTLDGAREEIAVEVSLFLFGAHFGSEQWRPYRAWLDGLTAQDAIITFNYDEAVEKLAEYASDPPRLHCPVPNSKQFAADHPTLFKLHGSAGWKVRKPESDTSEIDIETCEIERCDALLDFLNDYSYRPFIYTPGPEKLSLARQGNFWRAATDRVRTADEIHIIGYRFPDTDTFAQENLLSAIASNKSSHYVNIVLGPHVSDPKVQRAEELVYAAGKMPRAVKMFTQDYLRPAIKGKFDFLSPPA